MWGLYLYHLPTSPHQTGILETLDPKLSSYKIPSKETKIVKPKPRNPKAEILNSKPLLVLQNVLCLVWHMQVVSQGRRPDSGALLLSAGQDLRFRAVSLLSGMLKFRLKQPGS